jgi:hypothetical protein
MYWASHFTSSRKEEIRNDDDVRKLLSEFLHEHVLHWMECLSLLNHLNVAIECLRLIEGWVSVREFFNAMKQCLIINNAH